MTGLLLLLAVLAVRGGFLIARSDGLSEDPDAYRVIAETLSSTGVFGLPVTPGNGKVDARATAFRPPLYPWLLSWMVGPAGKLANLPVAIFHVFLGLLTVLGTWDIARRFVSTGAALFAAGLVLIDPILLWQSSLVMTESIATTLGVLVFWWWVVMICRIKVVGHRSAETAFRCRFDTNFTLSRAVVLGVLLLLAILCRPTFVIWAALIVPAIFFQKSLCRFRRVIMVVSAAVMVAGGVGAWAKRNQVAMGHPVWATTHGGYTLLLANNDSFYDYLETAQWQWPWQKNAWEPSDFFSQYQSLPRSGEEWTDDRVAYAAAKETIADRPKMFAYSCLIRWVRLWQPFPHATAGRSTSMILAVGLFHSAVYLLVLTAMLRHRDLLLSARWRSWLPLWPGLALVLTLSAVHAVYWSNPRMRSPAIPVLAIAAAAALPGHQGRAITYARQQERF